MDENPNYPLADWRYDVANGDTRLGYAEWVQHQLEAEPMGTCSRCGSDWPTNLDNCPNCGIGLSKMDSEAIQGGE